MRRKVYLAAILAAVMALQAPVVAFAEEEGTEAQTTSDDQNKEEENGSWNINGDVTITDDSWSSTDPENPSAEDDKKNPLKEVSAWNGDVVTVNGDVSSTVSQEKADGSGNTYMPQAVNVGREGNADKGGTVNVNGDVSSKSTGAVWADGGTANITGNVTSGAKEDSAIGVGDKGGTVHVGGDVTSQSSPAIGTNSSANISVDGNVTGTEGICINVTENTGGKVEVLGTVKATGAEGSAICIMVDEEEDVKNIPEITVGSLETQAEDAAVWIGVKSGGTDDKPEYADASAKVHEEVYQKILYYIAQDKFVNATLSVAGAEKYKDGYRSNEGKSLTVTIATADGYEVSSVSGASVVRNADGTYTVVVQRGKGIDINAVISAIVKAQEVTSSGRNDNGSSDNASSAVIVVPAYAAAQKQFQTAIAAQLKTLPAGGTLMLDMKDCISFNKKTFEILSQRKDVDIQIIYTWKGKKYLVVIPAGYDILSLLNADGYCGCLYLNSIFGSIELTK